MFLCIPSKNKTLINIDFIIVSRVFIKYTWNKGIANPLRI